MRERPILFSAPMVRAIQDDRKTQTRRVVTPQPPSIDAVYRATGARYGWTSCADRGEPQDHRAIGPVGVVHQLGGPTVLRCPYGAPGDRLWVRESGWQRPEVTRAMLRDGADTWPAWIYSADAPDVEWLRQHGWIRRPSIHMPRWASRITLEVTGVRLEQLQDISEADATAEGVDVIPLASAALTHRTAFAGLWDHINAKRGHSWASNPWVWVVEFRRVAGNDDE